MTTPATKVSALEQFVALDESAIAITKPPRNVDEQFERITEMIQTTRKLNRGLTSGILQGNEGAVGDIHRAASIKFHAIHKQHIRRLEEPALKEARDQKTQWQGWLQILQKPIDQQSQREQVFIDLRTAGFPNSHSVEEYRDDMGIALSDRDVASQHVSELDAIIERIMQMSAYARDQD